MRILELLLLGGLALAALVVRLRIAYAFTPGMDMPVGPDVDDWFGVFWGVTHSWPPTWDPEWSRRFPLLALAGLAVSRGLDMPILVSVQQIGILAGATLAPLTYLLGRRVVGRPAAFAAACWMVFQQALAANAVMTTAYSITPPLYLVLLLGLVGSLRASPRRSAAWVAGLGSFLLVLALLQGVMILLVTLAALFVIASPRLLRGEARLATIRRLFGPPLLGLVAAIPVLLAFPCRLELSPAHLWGRFAENYHHTWLYEVPVQDRTGYNVERLLAGMSRLEHFSLSVREQLEIPVLLLALSVLVAAVLFLMQRERPGAAPRVLLLSLLAGSAYGWIANSSEFHFFQWHPALALVVASGIVGWTALLPWPRLARALGWVLALAFVVFLQQREPPQGQHGPGGMPRYGDVAGQYDENRSMARMCWAAAGPVSTGGSLLVAVEHAWQYRCYMMGEGEVVDPRALLSDPERVAGLARPMYLLAPTDAAQELLDQLDIPGRARLLQAFDRRHLPDFVPAAGLFVVEDGPPTDETAPAGRLEPYQEP